MPTLIRSAVLLAAVLAAAACTPTTDPAGCGSDAQCAPDARCQAGTCVASARPVAAIRALAPVEAFALVDLDGSGSRVPDAAAIPEHVWTVRSLTAPCAPPDVAGAGPVARVRFACPGRFAVSLAVRDERGVESDPATVEVDVVAPAGTPILVAGPDLSTQHACAGDPLVCRPTDPIELSASTSVAGLSLRWTVEPPVGLQVGGSRRVALAPGAGGATVALIETDGAAIAGDWVFRVEARDAYGVVGLAHTRVSVGNRPPELAIGPHGPFPHRFDASRSRFTSSGEVAWSAWDPDGDPIEIAATWRHLGDGGGSFSGSLSPGSASFDVEVPYGTPADALLLRGGVGLSRTIELVATDVNRGTGRSAAPIDVDNRPPLPAGGVFDLRVPHRFDAIRSLYVADVRLGSWIDPDGDPLSAGPGTAPCGAVSIVDGRAQAECSVPFDGTPAADRIAGHRSLPVAVRDPWAFAAATRDHTVEILNSPPSLARAVSPATACAESSISWSTGCMVRLAVAPVSFTVAPVAFDPDGDPVLLEPLPAAGGSASPGQAICTTTACPTFQLVQPATIFCGSTYVAPSRLRATDGAAAAELGVSPDPTRC